MSKPGPKVGPIPEGYHCFDPSKYQTPEDAESLWKWLSDYDFEGKVYFKLEKFQGFEVIGDLRYRMPVYTKILYFELESDLVMLKLQLDREESESKPRLKNYYPKFKIKS